MYQWLGLVNTVMNFGVPLQVENFDLLARISRMTQPHSAMLLWVLREKEREGGEVLLNADLSYVRSQDNHSFPAVDLPYTSTLKIFL